jgi:CheY-like chemotaxis protein
MSSMEQTYPRETVFRALKNPIQVLLVEDDPESAYWTSAQVDDGRQGPFQVEWTDTLMKAMCRMTKPGVDVVLLDLGMPELTGAKAHLAITCGFRTKIPVVVLTSDPSPVSRNLTLQQGARGYLLKNRASALDIRRALHEAVME